MTVSVFRIGSAPGSDIAWFAFMFGCAFVTGPLRRRYGRQFHNWFLKEEYRR
jgi:hypothetical protein